MSHARSKFCFVVPKLTTLKSLVTDAPKALPILASSRRTVCLGRFFPASIALASVRLSMPAFFALMLRAPPRTNSPPAIVGEPARRFTITFSPFTSNSVTCEAWAAKLSSFASCPYAAKHETSKTRTVAARSEYFLISHLRSGPVPSRPPASCLRVKRGRHRRDFYR